ncbi:MAG: three-Cys-motif partner protein TcmP [Fluviicoccus sp.]|uniref:three-Cys-motif partner protein TcmP n=1 Tax=Fluviicoccus sp. TaxID=2003552 RepID=UPI002720B724|nr:three-Cys-motif partner protein TcmP [Fluviicoccus sp.]MDO8330309.1 three-Cys-motif partner protein TcmP [Fluviicoccus sp.]
MSKRVEDQKFGGVWTAEKLEALERYLKSYSTALKKIDFTKVYIDAFAGNGECIIKSGDCTVPTEGSVKRSLNVDPPFDKYYFIDLKPENHVGLRTLCAQYPALTTELRQGDANDELTDIITSINWQRTRGVLFLDPFGMTLKWDTLFDIAFTQAIDVWYLFPLSGMSRQAANNFDSVDASKKKSLTTLLGSTDWEEYFYKDDPGMALFDETNKKVRVTDQSQMLGYVKKRLESIFPSVLEPAILRTEGNAPLYALFFACANPNKRAQEIAGSIASHLIKKLNGGNYGSVEKQKLAELKKDNTIQPDLFG